MKNFWMVGLLALVIASCGSDDEFQVYDEAEQLEIDKQNIQDYLDENNITAETDDLGVSYVITAQGNGTSPENGDEVSVYYQLYLFNGQLIDTNIEAVAQAEGIYNANRDYVPLEFVIGTNQIIPGFQIATKLLEEGGSGDFYIPSVYAYRNVGSGGVPPDASLIFKIDLISIN